MKLKNSLLGLVRVILALVFIFSGFVKAIDPWGTAIKIDDYFQAFGLDFLSGTHYALSILQSAGEMWLGLCLLFRLGGRAVPRLAMWVMIFFTALTLGLAIWNPVSDCGCFGDAVKLTNWQTFYKNLVLLALSVLLVLGSRPRQDRWGVRQISVSYRNYPVEWLLGLCFFLFSVGVGVYSLYHLPLFDFLPYKVGTHFPSAMEPASSAVPESLSGGRRAVLIYRERATGQEREFDLEDTIWRDSTRWEFVDTRFEELQAAKPMPLRPRSGDAIDFAIFDGNGDVAEQLLASEGPWFLITMTDFSSVPRVCHRRYRELIDYARAQRIPVYGVTSASLADNKLWLEGDGAGVVFYNVDATTLKTMIRTHDGLMLFQDGILLGKWSCRDIPLLNERYAGRDVLSYLAEQPGRVHRFWLLGVLGGVLLLLYFVYGTYRRSRQ